MLRLIRPALGAVVLVAVLAAPVSASHTHVKQLGNGQCVLLAAGAGEADVVLPLAVFDHNPNVTIAPAANRMHPLHVLVHKGVPGDHNLMEVYGTTAGNNLCSAGYVGN